MGRDLPPGVRPDDRVILFDGDCVLCCGWVRFVTRRDPAAMFRFASVQSEVGRAVLAWVGLPLERFDTMVLVERGRARLRSDAFLRIVPHLAWPWPILALVVVVPRFLRDALYDRIARNRFRWFGRRETCLVPTPELSERFL